MWLAVVTTEMSLQDAKQMRRLLAAQAAAAVVGSIHCLI